MIQSMTKKRPPRYAALEALPIKKLFGAGNATGG
jgi:hypothetical protein